MSLSNGVLLSLLSLASRCTMVFCLSPKHREWANLHLARKFLYHLLVNGTHQVPARKMLLSLSLMTGAHRKGSLWYMRFTLDNQRRLTICLRVPSLTSLFRLTESSCQ